MRPTPLLNVLQTATPNLTDLRHQLQHSATAGRDIVTSERDTKRSPYTIHRSGRRRLSVVKRITQAVGALQWTARQSIAIAC